MPGVTGYNNGPGNTVTPPKYTGPTFCSVQDASNNTYQCLRILNSTNNQLYCEFDDDVHFIELYNVTADPYELKNLASVAKPDDLRILHQDLQAQVKCVGSTCHTAGFGSIIGFILGISLS